LKKVPCFVHFAYLLFSYIYPFMSYFVMIDPLIEQYAANHTSAESGLLRQIERDTIKHHSKAHMLSGRVQGRLLALISKMLQPKNILEIGTFTGYSALCLAEGLASGGELHTIEVRPDEAATSAKNFSFDKKNKAITLHIGNAKDLIPTFSQLWDLVFIDADKLSYINYYEMVLPRLALNGVIIADNTLFHGQVINAGAMQKNAAAIDAFNKHVLNDPRVEQVLLTVRDGLLIIKKI